MGRVERLARPRNLRSSWLSREIFFASVVTGALGASVLISFLKGSSAFWTGFTEGLAAASGIALLWSMVMAYRLRTVPAWDRWTTSLAFFAPAPAPSGKAWGES